MIDRSRNLESFSEESRLQWESIIEGFEVAWERGERQSLDQFLPQQECDRLPVLVELVHIDLEFRLKAGEPARVEEYLARYPELNDMSESVLDLIAAEFRQRRAAGQDVSPYEYLERFPQREGLEEKLDARFVAQDTFSNQTAPQRQQSTLVPLADGVGEEGPGSIARSSWPVISGYEILAEVGHGAMGVVYRARDLKHQAIVALKCMQHISPSALLRFKQEFRTLADLAHRNLVSLYDLVSVEGQWFFTMEYLEGVDFLTYVRGGDRAGESGLSAEQLSRLRCALRQLAQGVAVLHRAGKLHRDIKPSNVLVTGQQRLVLLDFGLAAELDDLGQHQSIEQQVVGTVAYMAPEQAASQPVSRASDWYSVGVMLYEALTGQLPFSGRALQILMEKQRCEPPAPRELDSGVPESLNALCIALLARNAEARPAGSEVLRQLGDHLAASAPSGSAIVSTQEAPVVGRHQHIQALWDAFRTMKQGRPVLVAIEGQSGAGKSTLLQCFLDQVAARDKAVILSGRCYEQESVPYKALDSLVDALSRYLRRLSLVEATALMPRYASQLARVFPVLQTVEAVARASTHALRLPDPHELRRRAFAALRELLGRLSDRHALLLCLDDLQWGDLDSASLLGDLMLPPNPPALLLLACYRSEDRASSPFLGSFLQSGARGSVDVREMVVDALTVQETRELTLLLLGDSDAASQEQADSIVRESGGSPLFIAELVHYTQSPAPAAGRVGMAEVLSLDGVLSQRIASLPDDARQILEVVAVAAQPLRQRDACTASGIGTDERPILALLRSSRLLRSTGSSERDEIETYHDRVRETIVRHLPKERLEAYHCRIAMTLSASAHADPERLAVHFQGAQELEKAGEYYAQAARQAALALAFDHAAKLGRLALELKNWTDADRRQLQVELGDALANAGRGSEAAKEYLAAANGADHSLALDLKRRAALQLMTSGHVDEGIAQLRPVLSAAGTKLAKKPWQALLSLLVRRAQLRVRGLGFRERRPEEVPPGDLQRIDICWSVVVGLSTVDPIRGADFQTRNLLLALRAGEPFRVGRALAVEAGFLASAGSAGRRRATQILERADHLAHRVDQPYARGMVEVARGTVAYFAEDWKTAHQLCTRAEAIFREHCTGVAWEIDTSSAFSLWSLTRMGAIAELKRLCPGLLNEALQPRRSLCRYQSEHADHEPGLLPSRRRPWRRLAKSSSESRANGLRRVTTFSITTLSLPSYRSRGIAEKRKLPGSGCWRSGPPSSGRFLARFRICASRCCSCVPTAPWPSLRCRLTESVTCVLRPRTHIGSGAKKCPGPRRWRFTLTERWPRPEGIPPWRSSYSRRRSLRSITWKPGSMPQQRVGD